MSQQELLIAVAAALDEHGIACMLTGSIASSLFGEPRPNHAIDLLAIVEETTRAGSMHARRFVTGSVSLLCLLCSCLGGPAPIELGPAAGAGQSGAREAPRAGNASAFW